MRRADAVVASGWRCYSYSWFVGRSDALVAALQEHCRTVTAAYKYPREIEFTDELPKTISGKIRRVEVRERELDRGG